MNIDITSRLRPFSHVYGERFLVPHTQVIARVFPIRVELAGEWIEFGWTGAVKQWTAQLDLERGELSVFGRAPEGYFSYVIKRVRDVLMLIVDKVPQGVVCRSSLFTEVVLEKKQRIELMTLESKQEVFSTRLSLGSHKAQDVSKMRERLDPCELFPLWLCIAEVCPSGKERRGQKGHYALLDKCDQSVERLLAFFSSAFTGVFVPRLIDTEYQGIAECVEEAGVSAIPLLIESAALIRSLFYQERGKGEVAIVPSEFHCGRFIDIVLLSGAVLSFEWTKNKLRRLILQAPADREVSLKVQLPRAIVLCRKASKRQGVHNVVVEEGVCCELAPGEKMELDRFHTR